MKYAPTMMDPFRAHSTTGATGDGGDSELKCFFFFGNSTSFSNQTLNQTLNQKNLEGMKLLRKVPISGILSTKPRQKNLFFLNESTALSITKKFEYLTIFQFLKV